MNIQKLERKTIKDQISKVSLGVAHFSQNHKESGFASMAVEETISGKSACP